MEIIVRLAELKYKENGQAKGFPEATEMFIETCILPNFTPEPWQEFRDEHLWKMEVCDVYDANMPQISEIYRRYVNVNHKFMDQRDCINLIMADAPCGVSEKDVCFAFGMCKMTIVQDI